MASAAASWMVKFREEGDKTFSFLGSNGTSTRLRVHAIRFPTKEAAQSFIDENSGLNPGLEFRVQS